MNKIITDAFIASVKTRGAKRLLRYIAREERAILSLTKKLAGIKEDNITLNELSIESKSHTQWLVYLRARTRCEYELGVVKNHRDTLWSEYNKMICAIEDEWV